MKILSHGAIAVLCLTITLGVVSAPPAGAQAAEVKEKAPLYTYAASWTIPRARWGDMAKDNVTTNKVLDRALANGTLVAYGNNETLVHTPEGATHVGWWCATSMAGLFNTLEEFYKGGTVTSPALTSATQHWDNVYVSRFYAWRAGTVKGGYVHAGIYQLKAEAPSDSVAVISKSFIVPLFEKLMTEGAVQAYQIAEQAIHTADPDLFFVFYVTAKAEGLDKVNAGLREAIRANSLAQPALASIGDFSRHRDELARGDSTFK